MRQLDSDTIFKISKFYCTDTTSAIQTGGTQFELHAFAATCMLAVFSTTQPACSLLLSCAATMPPEHADVEETFIAARRALLAIVSSSAGYRSLRVALYGIVTSYLCNIFDPCESRNLSVHSWDSNAPKITGISDDYPSQYTTRSQTGTTPGAARSAPGRLRVAFETHTRLPLHAPTALLPLT